jgi:hypothetical protein
VRLISWSLMSVEMVIVARAKRGNMEKPARKMSGASMSPFLMVPSLRIFRLEVLHWLKAFLYFSNRCSLILRETISYMLASYSRYSKARFL